MALSYAYDLKILFLTHTDDFYTTDLVSNALRDLGYSTFRFNMDAFPQKNQLVQRLSNAGHDWYLISDGKRIPVADFEAFWYRKYWAPQIAQQLEEKYKDGAFRESNKVLNAFLDFCSTQGKMIDPNQNTLAAERKTWQLDVARKLGITIPETLIGNSPEELKQFYQEQDKQLIVKMQVQLVRSMGHSNTFFYTQKVEEEHVKSAQLLHHSPMLFQNEIAKMYELRVIFINGHFFCGKIDATNSNTGQTDWRVSKTDEVAWEPYQLPNWMEEKLTAFMHEMKLIYGAIDLIRDKQGNYIFLEVNPQGEWGMLQRDLDLPIAEAIATALIQAN